MQARVLILSNDVNELARLTTFIEKLRQEWNLSDKLAMTLNLILEELITNIIFYAYKPDATQLIELSVKTDGNEIIITLKDEGKPFNPTKVPDPDYLHKDAEERQIGGMGIYLARKMVDDMQYKRIKNCNKLILKKKIE
ncbi:MAG: ATP-binding protein [Bacteroidales bacterium]|nr:ATP-binding protein [Bacteroidales bacterium]MDZ4205109.1 ATP-binding protein [Bacteroidales bacterium]